MVIPSPSEYLMLLDHMVKLTISLKEKLMENRMNKILLSTYKEFIDFLNTDLELDEFLDTYAQIITYGLFSARIINKKTITLNTIPKIISSTNPFLKKTFSTFFNEFPSIICFDKVGINTFLEILNKINLKSLIDEFNKYRQTLNPILHFYELFLSKYNPKIKLERGIFYTPDSIVSFIIRSVDILLRDQMNINLGLNDQSVLILDPAMGTGTFLNEIVRVIKENFDRNSNKLSENDRIAEWNQYVSLNLLPRVFGFELLITPYIIAHLQFALLLETTGYDFKNYKQGIGIFLTNTLKGTHYYKPNLTNYLKKESLLTEEEINVNKIKIKKPLSVIVGNPPYSKFSSNKECHWIEGLMKGLISDGTRRSNYYEVDGKPIQERKIHLLDDYVKFIRFAQWRIEKTGYGIVAFITNHGFLSNPTFRGMRQQLLEAFDQFYILDLHGNILKGEITPNGLKDENVFDIKQGSSIVIMIKKKEEGIDPQMFHFDLWGTRNNKYHYLQHNDITSISWTQIIPRSPYYFYYPIDWALWEEYNKGWKLIDIFSVYGVGIVTARDKLTIHPTKEDIWSTVVDFGTLPPDKARKKYKLGKDAESWRVVNAQNDLRKIGLDNAISRENDQIHIIDETLTKRLKKQYIKPINYRPFNRKYTFYTGNSNGFLARPVYSIMEHLLQENNLSLITTRLTKGEEFKHVFVSNIIFEQIFLSPKTSNSAYSFPLYRKSLKMDVLVDNISKDCVQYLSKHWKLKYLSRTRNKGDLISNFTSLDIFYYIYAILHSSIYRSRYRDFLGLDFPNIPFSCNLVLVRELISKGRDLVELHLIDVTIENRCLEREINEFSFSESLNRTVKNLGKEKYVGNRLYLNNQVYIDGIPEEVFNFRIGGYSIIEKWIRENKNQEITKGKLRGLKNILAVIKNTIVLSSQIDNVIVSTSNFLKK